MTNQQLLDEIRQRLIALWLREIHRLTELVEYEETKAIEASSEVCPF